MGQAAQRYLALTLAGTDVLLARSTPTGATWAGVSAANSSTSASSQTDQP